MRWPFFRKKEAEAHSLPRLVGVRQHSSDDAIRRESDDALGRGPYVAGLASILLDTPGDESLRIGVYGSWGEGKSSVLHLLEERVRNSGNVPVWLSPWPASSALELRAKLLVAIARELEVSATTIKHAPKLAKTIRGVRDAGAALDPRLKAANELFGPLIQSVADGLTQRSAESLIPALIDAAGGRKVVVLVDDLDRIKPELLPEFLLTLREGLELPGFRFVLGLAPDIVHLGLESLHEGWRDTGSFLEKIVEYPSYLPAIGSEQLAGFIEKEIRKSAATTDAAALKEIAHLLPRNPRKCKLFLRYLGGFASLTSRLAPGDLSLEPLYIGQLLRWEFPKEGRELVEDPDAMKAVSAHVVSRYGNKDTTELLAPAKRHAENSADPSRFLQLIDELTSVAQWSDENEATAALRIMDKPPLLTWKEVVALANAFDEKSAEGKSALVRAALTDPESQTLSADRCDALFRKLLILRERAFDNAIERDIQSEVLAALEEVNLVTRILELIIDELRLFETRLLTGNAWILMLLNFAKYSKWVKPVEYLRLREDEWRLLSESLAMLPSESRIEAFRELYRHGRADVDDRWAEKNQEIAAEARQKGAILLAKNELIKFADGTERPAVFAVRDTREENFIWFDPQSPVHSGALREDLRTLLTNSERRPSIASNAQKYFLALCYSLDNRTLFNAGDAITILKDDGFAQLLWRAAVSVPLNRRMMGSLKDGRDALIARQGFSASDFPMPKWADDQ